MLFILLLLFVAQVKVDAVSLRDNLRLEVNPVSVNKIKSSDELLNENSSIKKEVVKNLGTTGIDSNFHNIENDSVRKINEYNPTQQGLVFNDKVYRLLMQKNKPMRPDGIIYNESEKVIDISSLFRV